MAAKKPAPAKDTKDEAAAAPAKKTNLLLIVLIAVVATSAIVGGALFFLLGGKDGENELAEGEVAEQPAPPKGPAVYIKLDPAFVVNLSDPSRQRYLQADVSLMSRTPEAQAKLEEHMPLVRNTLLMLFSQQQYDALVTREGKEMLQQSALEELQGALETAEVPVVIEEMLFTSLVMQ